MSKKNTAAVTEPKAVEPKERKMASRQFVIQKQMGSGQWADIEVPEAKNAADALAWLKRNAAGDKGEPTVAPGVYRVARVAPPVNLAVQTVAKAVLT